MHCKNHLADFTYGMVTVGERGQIVIPAEARRELGINPGDKLLVVRHPGYAGFMAFKIEALRDFLEMFQEEVKRLESQYAQSGGSEE